MKVIDIKLFKFIIVGIINTATSMVLMVILYNKMGLGYWGSSAIAYTIGGLVSFLLNKNFTFNNSDSNLKTGVKFIINIILCYIIAYSLAKPCITYVLRSTNISNKNLDNCSMLFGMVLFTVLNYFGQRFFAFKDNN